MGQDGEGKGGQIQGDGQRGFGGSADAVLESCAPEIYITLLISVSPIRLRKKISCISGPMLFKPVLFKGQLYTHTHTHTL